MINSILHKQAIYEPTILQFDQLKFREYWMLFYTLKQYGTWTQVHTSGYDINRNSLT